MGNTSPPKVEAPYLEENNYQTKFIDSEDILLKEQQLQKLHGQYRKIEEYGRYAQNFCDKSQQQQFLNIVKLIKYGQKNIQKIMSFLLKFNQVAGYFVPVLSATMFLIQLSIDDQITKMKKYVNKEIGENVLRSVTLSIKAALKTAQQMIKQSEQSPIDRRIKIQCARAQLLRCINTIQCSLAEEDQSFQIWLAKLDKQKRIELLIYYHQLFNKIASMSYRFSEQRFREEYKQNYDKINNKLKEIIIRERIDCIKYFKTQNNLFHRVQVYFEDQFDNIQFEGQTKIPGLFQGAFGGRQIAPKLSIYSSSVSPSQILMAYGLQIIRLTIRKNLVQLSLEYFIDQSPEQKVNKYKQMISRIWVLRLNHSQNQYWNPV